MIVQSTIKPDPFWVRYVRFRSAGIRLRKNITQSTNNGDIIFAYDEVEVTIPVQPNLEDYITANFDSLYKQGNTNF